MSHRQQFCFFAVLFLGAMNLSDVASAQFAPDPFFYRKPHEIAPKRYQKLGDGTILEMSTGNIYDRKGNLIQRGNGSRTREKQRCKYTEVKECGLYNFNCTPEWEWVCDE
jgi:hypothetical protein